MSPQALLTQARHLTTPLGSFLTLPSQTPAVLQRSGVGDAFALTPLEIPVVVDLKTVGKNLQEQTLNVILELPKDGFDGGGIGPMEALAFPNIHQLFGEGADASIAKIRGSLKSWAQSEAHNALSVEALETILTIQAEVIVDDSGQSPTTVHSREVS